MTNADATSAPPHEGGSVRAGWSGVHRLGHRRLRTSTLAMWGWIVLTVAVVAVALGFQASGGRWFIVETPSMGEAAPVGTFVLTQPVAAGDLAVGDIVSFHPPTAPGEVYTHRIVSIDGGLVTTQGDINSVSDPWTLSDGDLIGRATAVLPGVGWLIRCLPWLLGGGIAVWIAGRFVRSATRRVSWLILGWSLVAAVTAFIVRPFVGVMVLTSKVTSEGAVANLVSTGLLPIRVQAVGGSSLDLAAGQVGRVVVPTLAETGTYRLAASLDLDFWGWVAMGAVCAIPLLWCLIVGLPPDGPDEASPAPRRHEPAPLTIRTAS